MRPGQREPNEFEVAILKRLAEKDPSILPALKGLRIQSREFTCVGIYTNFLRDRSGEEKDRRWNRVVDLDVAIDLPCLENGLIAILFCKGNQPDFLEVVAMDEHWDGVYDGFSIAPDK